MGGRLPGFVHEAQGCQYRERCKERGEEKLWVCTRKAAPRSPKCFLCPVSYVLEQVERDPLAPMKSIQNSRIERRGYSGVRPLGEGSLGQWGLGMALHRPSAPCPCSSVPRGVADIPVHHPRGGHHLRALSHRRAPGTPQQGQCGRSGPGVLHVLPQLGPEASTSWTVYARASVGVGA